jgi:hypothetical protein
VLARLTEGLELGTPLSTTYRLFERTGQPGYGDPSPHILAGSVVAPKPDRSLPRAVSHAQQRRAQLAYATCMSRLSQDARDFTPTTPRAIVSGV